MGPAKLRRIREAVTRLFKNADPEFLRLQAEPEQLARSLAWELENAGYCTHEESQKEVLPYLLRHQEILTKLRSRRLQEPVSLFSDLPKQLGVMIRQARKRCGWTQAQLAKAAGTQQPVVSRIERGESLKQPTMELVDRMAQALGHQLEIRLVPLKAKSPKPKPGSTRERKKVKA